MSKDDGIPRKPLEIGEMPTVREVKTPMGIVFEIDGYTPGGNIITFSSSPLGARINLLDEQGKRDAASLIAHINVEYKMDAAVGPGYSILYNGCIIPTPEHASVYVDKARVGGFSLSYPKIGIGATRYYSAEQRATYDEVLPKAYAVLPKPPQA